MHELYTCIAQMRPPIRCGSVIYGLVRIACIRLYACMDVSQMEKTRKS